MTEAEDSNQLKEVQATEILAKIEKGEPVKYNGVTIVGDLDLNNLDLPAKKIDRFRSVIFKPKFLTKYLIKELILVSSPVEITNTVILGDIEFSNALFEKLVSFKGSSFLNVNFMGSWFQEKVDFSETIFEGGAHFIGSQFNGAYFKGAKFEFGNFERAKFNAKPIKNGPGIPIVARFDKAKIGMFLKFDDSYFAGAFFCFDLEGSFTLKKTKFEDPHTQASAYGTARRKAEEDGMKEEADYYHYHEMVGKRKINGRKGLDQSDYSHKNPFFWVFKFKRFFRYDLVEHVLIQIIFGYGVHPLRLFGFWIVMVFGFALIYWYSNAILGAGSLTDYIWFSIATAATPGYALFKPEGQYQLVSGLEAIIGTFMWAAFIATFARKYMR